MATRLNSLQSTLPALILAIGVTAFTVSPAWADGIVSPSAFANMEGDSGRIYPLLVVEGMRWQQVHAASEFSATVPLMISGFSFRSDGWYELVPGPHTAFLSDVEILMSTTTRDPGALSTVFDENRGPDIVTVRSGPLTFSTSGDGADGGPHVFDIAFPFSEPFITTVRLIVEQI